MLAVPTPEPRSHWEGCLKSWKPLYKAKLATTSWLLATFGEMGWFGGLARFSWPQGSAENRTFLRGSLSVILIEVPILSTSPKAAKSRPLLHRWGMTLT
jgi:hypothetical protein